MKMKCLLLFNFNYNYNFLFLILLSHSSMFTYIGGGEESTVIIIGQISLIFLVFNFNFLTFNLN